MGLGLGCGCFAVAAISVPLLFIGMVLFLIANPFRTAELAKFTGETQARVISADKTSWKRCDDFGCDNEEGYNVVYRYEFNKGEYEATLEKWSDFDPRNELRICYNPDEPDRHSPTQSEDICGDQFYGRRLDAERID